jgi:hypothetical protein
MPQGFQTTSQRSLTQSARVTLRIWWRIARQLFLEVAGALFALCAVFGSLLAWRQWRSKPAAWLIGFAILYALVMIYFSVTSFRRARRVR